MYIVDWIKILKNICVLFCLQTLFEYNQFTNEHNQFTKAKEHNKIHISFHLFTNEHNQFTKPNENNQFTYLHLQIQMNTTYLQIQMNTTYLHFFINTTNLLTSFTTQSIYFFIVSMFKFTYWQVFYNPYLLRYKNVHERALSLHLPAHTACRQIARKTKDFLFYHFT